MNVLGFDTSTSATAACVLHDGREEEVVPDPGRLSEPPGHARELMPAVAEVMGRAGLDFADLDAIAVGIGPGAFTGLRIGIATARALALANALQVRAVSSLAALAEGIPASTRLAVIDAKREQVFAALFEDGTMRWGPVAATPAEVAERAMAAADPPLAAGDGAVRFQEVLQAAGVRVEPARSRAHVVRGLHVCRLAAAAAPTSPEAVLPQYLRLPDAKPR